MSLVIEGGDTVALVGPSGCGKSSAVQLIERFYDPSEGAVFLDGQDIKSLSIHSLRQQIGLVSQEPILFAGTVEDNIRMGKKGCTDDDVVAAAKMSNAHDFISTFPDGYKTECGAGSSQLSGGQKQRIAIARAIIRDPSVLILDEATSALDATSERVVQEALDQLLAKKKRTTIIIAHRLSTIRNADKIVVLDGGTVVEVGTHDSLMAIEGGTYKQLVKNSFGRESTQH
jgi:ATP-binding cassette subfamily B (MDR/TAP) protein 1